MTFWGEQYQGLLEYREILIYWRRLIVDNSAIRVSQAASLWKGGRRDEFRQRLTRGWTPDLVTDFIDEMPFSRVDLRLPALRHDIKYCIGGSAHEKLDADIALRQDIIETRPHSKYVFCLAWFLYFCLRTRISDRHFCFGPRARALPEYHILLNAKGVDV